MSPRTPLPVQQNAPLISVLGSSQPLEGSLEYETGRELGRELARRGARVLCGGYRGVMEAACRGVAEAGGTSIGILLAGGGGANPWVTEAVIAADLAERLRRLRDDAAAWIFLPRGLGTLLELAWIAESIVKGEVPPRPFVLLGDAWKPTVEIAVGEASGPGARRLAEEVVFASDPGSAAAAALRDPV